MGLHAIIPDHELPRCLTTRPLVFGDTEQLEALRLIEGRVELIEKREQEIKNGKLSQWQVDVEISGNTTVTVWAHCKEEAKELATEDLGVCDCDDIDMVATWAKQIKGKDKKL